MQTPGLGLFPDTVLFGFYLPPIMLWAVLALVPFLVLRLALQGFGLYRFVWHRALFNVALYVLVLGGLVYLGVPAWL